MYPEFDAKKNGVQIVDPIERHRYFLKTETTASLDSVTTSLIPFPVDSAVRSTISRMALPRKNTVYIYEGKDSVVEAVDPNDRVTLPQSEYLLDISTWIKVYLKIKSSVEVYSDIDTTYIDPGEPSEAIIGARSLHTRPAGKITTTTKPADLMRAVSAFGSVLKTTGPERAYPSLRGHPPELKIGEELSIPSDLREPDTSVRIEVPPELGKVFVVTPLAYYLGAKVTPGPHPKITLGSSYSFDLTRSGEFERTVKNTLRKIVFFDSIVRTEGPLSPPLAERDAIEPILGYDTESLYYQSQPDRLRTYLETSFEEIEQYLPQWRESRMEAVKKNALFLPFIANDLTTVKIQRCKTNIANKYETDIQARAVCQAKINNGETERCVIEQRWENENNECIVSKVPLSTFYNNINRKPKDGPIEIDVVCNDADMSEELVGVYGTYGSRKGIPFELNVHHDLTRAELREVLATENDLFHYIGHITKEGFQCEDGHLDAKSVEEVGSKAFLLNACQSYEQGIALIEAGSIGGITTLEAIDNRDAVRVGSLIARLLNQGFPLYAAVEITEQKFETGGQYLIVGNGTTTVAQPGGGFPIQCSLDEYRQTGKISLKLYNNLQSGIGTIYQPHINSSSLHHLSPKKIGPFSVTRPQLVEFLDMGGVVAVVDGSIRIGDDIGLKEIASGIDS